MTTKPANYRIATQLVQGGVQRSSFGETAEALYLTSGYVYDSAEQAEGTFAGTVDRYQYSRFANPTLSMLEERLCLIEGAEACRTTATGMAAVNAALLAHLKAGDRVVASRALFGSCHWIVSTLLPKFGIATEFVDCADLGQWRAALSRPAQLVLLETPSNPMLELVDLRAVADLAHAAGAIVVVDNVFATPLLQQPLKFGADVVVYSCTKHIDGQGRVLGGAVLGSRKWITEIAAAVHPQHRPGAVTVQCLGAAEGAGDLGAAGRCCMPRCRDDRRIPRRAARGDSRVVSDARRSSPAGIGIAADDGRRDSRDIRGGGGQGRGVQRDECVRTDRGVEQPG